MNPLPFIARTRFEIESSWSICHGDLNCSNILMAGMSPWFIDFASTGPGPTALDWATLEASLKFDHPWKPKKGAAAWFRFEEALALQGNLSKPQPTPGDLGPELEKLYHTITALRAAVMDQAKLVSNPLEYFIALLYATVHQVRFYWNVDTKIKAYRILASAGLIAERLLGDLTRRNNIGVLFRWQNKQPIQIESKLPPVTDILQMIRIDESKKDDPKVELPEEKEVGPVLESLKIVHVEFLQSLLSETLGQPSPFSNARSDELAELERALLADDDDPEMSFETRLKILQRLKNMIRTFEKDKL